MPTDWTRLFDRHHGQWVALANDETTVIAAAPTAREALKASAAKGSPEPFLSAFLIRSNLLRGMKFEYMRLSRAVARPIVPISVRHPDTRKAVRYFALVDSGAYNCILGAEIGELIGLAIKDRKPSTISGVVAGQSRPYYIHAVEIEIGCWQRKSVGFMPELSKNGHGFVGRLGFFDRFSFVKFDQRKNVVEFGSHL
jgi:hypothetical protein